MDSQVEIFIKRANNELLAAESLKRLSEEIKFKDEFSIPQDATFYSSVISHAYYAIFYSAKAILLTKNIKTDAPEVHKKTLEEFKKNFVDSGILDLELLKIYNKMIIRADELLFLFKEEKRKRGQFVYKTIPQANIEQAEESIENAKKFLVNIKKIIE